MENYKQKFINKKLQFKNKNKWLICLKINN